MLSIINGINVKEQVFTDFLIKLQDPVDIGLAVSDEQVSISYTNK